ncbi:MAG: 50S ribosomal protein L13 [Candidatus Magasanikbacteria bacterium]
MSKYLENMPETKKIDAKNKKLGRLASRVAEFLQDKHLPSYNPSKPGKTRVVILNADKIEVSGNKKTQKEYFKHTEKPGSYKKESFEDVFEKNPALVIRNAVSKMLPKNKLRDKRMKRLEIKTEEEDNTN